MKVHLALDYGRKRIGVAVSTELGTVHPRPRINRTTAEEDMRVLEDLVRKTAAEAIVLGLPHHMDGSQSEMEVEVREFATVLAVHCGRPVYGMDERLTTEAADAILKDRHPDPRARKERRDSAAACIVLQDFLDAGGEAERIA